ncbi:ABC transporter permease [Gordonia sp. ABSL1-1]|uniref:ABC transporter permease n=1 Tax=Gordonia sp. ABSL1-1 TaxID=3053923 RepID=UPI0025731C44|nr:ABC transporter permease [Gordonia sp. ABSL1-1]MDL9935277.1 ABC transporter permease [Gordonia sp. ABSL1-1]
MSGIDDGLVNVGPALGVAVAALAIIAIIVNHYGGAGLGAATARAALRAVIQLAALAAVLAVVITHLWSSLLFVAVMASVASWTSAGRITGCRATLTATLRSLLPVAAATIAIVALMVAIGVLPATGLAIIPTAGILFGGAMNTASLAGKRAHDELRTRHGEVEAALSLGFATRDARMEVVQTAAATALIPGLDQTRSVGLVTIPGAFVGMVLGGASTTAAAVMQLFVLITLLVVSGIAAAITVEMVARGDM